MLTRKFHGTRDILAGAVRPEVTDVKGAAAVLMSPTSPLQAGAAFIMGAQPAPRNILCLSIAEVPEATPVA
ncbi:hypothetical protein BST12_11290 [Mycobacterium angelicum]|uniref:Uncharacterized protein n=1 Tax=Mycobacterium angelicum TaxID=470074 RepID=A0A1W9ZVU9_MYCAN|nr:hypothetical protein BST12_11290 [Mycobacterium angelicum]